MNVGTHEDHCCKIHGCKYGDEDCPVAAGVLAQAFPCEDCPEGWEPGKWAFIIEVICPDGTVMKYTRGKVEEKVGTLVWDNLSKVMGIYDH